MCCVVDSCVYVWFSCQFFTNFATFRELGAMGKTADTGGGEKWRQVLRLEYEMAIDGPRVRGCKRLRNLFCLCACSTSLLWCRLQLRCPLKSLGFRYSSWAARCTTSSTEGAGPRRSVRTLPRGLGYSLAPLQAATSALCAKVFFVVACLGVSSDFSWVAVLGSVRVPAYSPGVPLGVGN